MKIFDAFACGLVGVACVYLAFLAPAEHLKGSHLARLKSALAVLGSVSMANFVGLLGSYFGVHTDEQVDALLRLIMHASFAATLSFAYLFHRHEHAH